MPIVTDDLTFATADLTFNVADAIGADFDPVRTKVWIEANVSHLTDQAGHVIRFPDAKATIGTDGTGVFAGLITTDSTDVLPASGRMYRVWIDWARPSGGREKWDSKWFELTSDSDLSLVAKVSEITVVDSAVVASISTMLAEITEISGVATVNDAINLRRGAANGVAPLDGSSLVPAANIPAAPIDAAVSTAVASGGKVWKVGPTAVNVRQYGVTPAAAAGTNDAGLAALFADYTGAVILGFADVGTYQFGGPLPARSNLSVQGVTCGVAGMVTGGAATTLRFPNGALVGSTTTAATLASLHFADVAIDNLGGTGSLFDMGLTGLIQSTFERVDLKTEANGGSIFKARGARNLYGIKIRDSYLRRNATATVPAFDVISDQGGVNGWVVSDSLLHSYGCTTSPFFRLESTAAASFLNNLVFRNLIAEQNAGGVIHLYGAMGCRVEDVLEWDATSYVDDLFKFGTSSSGAQSYQCSVERVGTPGAVTFAAGKVPVNFASGFNHRSGTIFRSSTSWGAMASASNGRTGRWGVGEAKSLYTVNSNTTLTLYMETVIFDGAGLTGTLPDPVANSIPAGREYVIKNRNASALTVAVASPATIDGATTKSLAQNVSARFICDGTNWITI